MTARAVPVALLAFLLIAPIASAGPWLQPRGDAAATGFQPEDGPDWPDVALRAEVPGDILPEAGATSLILEDQVLFLARPYADSSDDAYRVFSVDVDTGNVTIVAEEIPRAGRLIMATDGQTVYVSSARSVHAFPLEPGGNEWTWTWDPLTQAKPTETGCIRMTVDHGHVTVLCSEHDEAESDDATGVESTQADAGYGDVSLVARLDAATGEGWMRAFPEADPQQDDQSDPRTFPIGLAVSASRVVVQLGEISGANGGAGSADAGIFGGAQAGQAHITVRALAAEDGQSEWAEPWTSPPVNVTQTWTPVGDPAGVGSSPRVIVGNPAASADRVYVKADAARALNLGTGEELPGWTQTIGKQDTRPGLAGGTAIALGENHVFLTTAQTVYRIHTENPKDGWSRSLNLSTGQGFDEDPIVTPSSLYTVIEGAEGPETVLAFDTDDGAIGWRHPAGELSSYSVGHGLLAYTQIEIDRNEADTTLVLLGQTEASPEPVADIETAYPEPGEPVVVNLSSSKAGLEGAVTRYKAIWGDGGETAWQSDPVLKHAYDEAGDKTARFIVANEANQTASTTRVFHVGQEEPTEPNWLSERFEPENQEMTFGVLGIALALGGGVIGVGRRYRKRARLQDELDALEQGFEETKETPSECEALLDNRKARARSLALDGKLEEDQVAIIENRAEELRAELRVEALEEQFAFLPYGLVTKARQMVEDGKVTALERDAFLQAIEEDDVLTSEQQALVRERIEQWFARDAGGGAG